MSRAKSKVADLKVGAMPSWTSDTLNQTNWNERFMQILARDYNRSNATIRSICSDKSLAQRCATRIRSYVDKQSTMYLYQERKNRGKKLRRDLETAIPGLHAAIRIYEEKGDRATATEMSFRAFELSGFLERCKDAHATKRHGRDRAHSILSECQSFLEKRLGQRISRATLASLVNAGFEADGNLTEEPLTEEIVRKNLAHFRRNNPFWRDEIDPHFGPRLMDPATK